MTQTRIGDYVGLDFLMAGRGTVREVAHVAMHDGGKTFAICLRPKRYRPFANPQLHTQMKVCKSCAELAAVKAHLKDD